MRSRPTRALLRVVGRVEPGEGLMVALLLACLFLILCGYYLLKTAREGLILSHGRLGLSGPELKAYTSGAMALLLIGAMPMYDALANRVTRIRLINISYALVLACLVAFFVLAKLGVPIALPFFLWLGLTSVFLIAQFWSFANDLYTEDQGHRLFAVIAVGGSLGSVLGPRLAGLATTFGLLVLAGALILPAALLFNVIDRLHVEAPHAPPTARLPIAGDGGFRTLWTDRYLRLVAGLVFVAAVVNTIGEYVLSDAAARHAAEHAATTDARRELIKSFYAGFYFWVNLVSFLVQLFVVSRVIHALGVRRALFLMPIVALGAYATIAAIGGLALVRVAKIAENSTDYSLYNTLRQTLFLPTARAAKYKAKATIDTFGVRTGDAVSALTIWSALHLFGLQGRGLALVNLVLVTIWLAIASGIVGHHRSLGQARLVGGSP